MKNKFFFSFLLLLTAQFVFGQPVKITGTWEGKLNVGIELRIVFQIKQQSDGSLKSTADSPDQSAFGLKCDTTVLSGNELNIQMIDLGATFTGKMIDDSTIEGVFTQGSELPLTLKKVEKVSEIKRPQTPKPPFTYKSEDVIYHNADKSLQYGATITIPEGNGPFPAAVLITGSGPQDRDESILGHKPFAVIADHLTKNGYIVLRVDDRGVGKSTGNFDSSTSEDFAKDVSNSIDYLLTRPETDKKKVGMIGHSEGGMIAPMVATARRDINFIVLLAGPGVRIVDLMEEQNAAVLRSMGISEKAVTETKYLFRHIVNAIQSAGDSLTALQQASIITENWKSNTSDSILTELQFNTPEKRKEYVKQMVNELYSPWFSYFMKFNPGLHLKKLRCKVLALNGSKDIQVISSQNLEGIKSALKKSKAKAILVKELPGLNHLFQQCNKCNIDEYGQLEETFSPLALQEISNWMNTNVK
jgi:hypothetical protein